MLTATEFSTMFPGLDDAAAIPVLESLVASDVIDKDQSNLIYNELYSPCWAVLDHDGDTVVSTHGKEPTYVSAGTRLVKVLACTCEDNKVMLYTYDPEEPPYLVFEGIDATNFALCAFGPLLLFTERGPIAG